MEIAGGQLAFGIDNQHAKVSFEEAGKRKELYHYTSVESLVYILRDRCLKFNRIDAVNDVAEAEYFKNIEVAHLVYISCFSYGTESIPMWNIYSHNDGLRISLKFGNDHITGQLLNKSQLVIAGDKRIRYVDAVCKNDEVNIDDIWQVEIVQKDVVYDSTIAEKDDFIKSGNLYDMHNMGLVKDAAWDYEKETRMVATLRTTKGADPTDPNVEKVEIPDYRFLLIPIKLENAAEIEITFGPWMSDVMKDVVRLVVDKYADDIKDKIVFSDSIFTNKIRR